MAAFLFQAKTASGKFVQGEVEAASESEARVKIRAQQLLPLKIVSKGSARVPGRATAIKSSGRVKPKELQVFTRQFAVLIGAGVPVVQSLEAMMGGGKSPTMNAALKSVIDDVGKGKRLAEAMANYPGVFDRMYVNLVRAGEEGGVLDTVLNRLAEYIEKSVKLRGKVIGALFYPAAIILVAIIVIVAILVFVIPNFVEMFASSGKELPALTQWVINASEFVQQRWYFLAGTFVALPLFLRSYYGTADGKKTIDSIVIDIPVFGGLIQKGSIARFSRTLSTLLGAGVRIIDALEIAAATAGNYVIEMALIRAKDSISKGKTVSEPLRKNKYIPDMVVQMISVGEQTGGLDAMLGKVADFYEDEVETAAEALTSMIEPLLMVFLGGIIAVLVIAMYLPIFNLASTMGG